ncbi:MAG TPA: hypothetical protein VGI39_40240 [Polyangiaceae bacterium]|jgi:hypothetical protein
MIRVARVACSAVLGLLVAPVAIGGCSAAPDQATPEQTSEAIAFQPDAAAPVCPPSIARTAPGYDPAWPHLGASQPIPGFSDELTALGCGPETVYYAGPGLYGELAVAYCPSAPPAPVWTMPGDACVGTPPPGWVVAVWKRYPVFPPPPAAGCHVTSCYTM